MSPASCCSTPRSPPSPACSTTQEFRPGWDGTTSADQVEQVTTWPDIPFEILRHDPAVYAEQEMWSDNVEAQWGADQAAFAALAPRGVTRSCQAPATTSTRCANCVSNGCPASPRGSDHGPILDRHTAPLEVIDEVLFAVDGPSHETIPMRTRTARLKATGLDTRHTVTACKRSTGTFHRPARLRQQTADVRATRKLSVGQA